MNVRNLFCAALVAATCALPLAASAQNTAAIASASQQVAALIGQLQGDDTDYGGHRVAAIGQMKKAEKQLVAAEQYAASHNYGPNMLTSMPQVAAGTGGNPHDNQAVSNSNMAQVQSSLNALVSQLQSDGKDYGGHRLDAIKALQTASNDLTLGLSTKPRTRLARQSRRISDEEFMRRALALAQTAGASGDVPVGAVLVCGDRSSRLQREGTSARSDRARRILAFAPRRKRSASGACPGDALRHQGALPDVRGSDRRGAYRTARLRLPRPKGGAAGSVIDVFGGPVNHRVAVESGLLEEETAEQLRAFFASRRQLREPDGAASYRGGRPGQPRRGGRVVEGTRLESGRT